MKKETGKTTYSENLAELRRHYPEIADRVEACPLNIDYEMRGTGSKNLVNLFVKKAGAFYYDEESPLEGVERDLRALKVRNAKLAVFLGFGLGYELQYYLDNLSGEAMTQMVAVVEKDVEPFKIALHMFDYRPLFGEKKIRLFVGETPDSLFTKLADYLREGTRILYAKAIKALYVQGAFLSDKEYYFKVMAKVREAVTYILGYYGNSPEDSLIGVENMLDNLVEIIKNPGINLLYGKYEKKPAIIVSTGPSLNKNKHLLKGLEDKALIIAADASLKVLMEMDVKPHMVTSLERFPETAKLMEGYAPDAVEHVYYASCPVIHKSCYEAYPGPRIMVYRNFDHFKWLDIDKGMLDIKHSAGNMAFKLAAALGCDPIILIGQDLAYGRDGKTHAEGNVYGDRQEIHYTEEHKANPIEVMGNDGQMIRTHKHWNTFRQAYEVDIAQYGGTCINSTEGGAYINGTTIMPFAEAISKYITESFDPLGILEKGLSVFSVETERSDVLRISEKIKHTTADLLQVKDMCMSYFTDIRENEEQFRTYLEADHGPFTEAESEQIHSKAMEVQSGKAKVFAVQPTMQLFMMHIFQPYFINFEIDLHGAPDQYEKREQVEAYVYLEHKKFFGVLHNLIEICIGSLERAEKDIEGLTF